jgi:polysaccharide export outer membrane protein
MKQVLIGFACLLALGGCVTQKKAGLDPAGAVVTSLKELPPPGGPNSTERSDTYRVGAFDELAVKIFGSEEMSGDVTVDGDGRVTVPLAGTVDALGLTQIELSQRIAANLRRYMKNPQVTVNVKDAKSRTITVDGQVKDPGVFKVAGNLTLMRAIANAKGVTNDANVKDVVVFRVVEGQQMAALYDLGAIRRGTYKDPTLFSQDLVVVGDSPRSRLLREIGPVIASPLILLLQSIL